MTNLHTETDRARQRLYQQLMRVPHREYGPMVSAFREALEHDPLFVSRACAYLAMGGTKIRDQQNVAVITLMQSDPQFPEFREAGRVTLLGSDFYETIPAGVPGLAPYNIFRVQHHIRNSDRKVPRLLRSTMTDYLRRLEADPRRWDGVAIQNRRALTSAYKFYHVEPSERARAILFEGHRPEGSVFEALKVVAEADDPLFKVETAMKANIPYRILTSVLPRRTPEMGIALIDAMSPTEALNARSWVEQSGLLDIAEVRTAYEKKVAQATASIASADFRRSAQGVDEGVQEAVEEAKAQAVRKAEKIEDDVLICVDRSSSMQKAIQEATHFGARLAPHVAGELMVVVFNDFAVEINVPQHDLESWQHAMRQVRAGGSTNIASSLEYAYGRGFDPGRIVLISDGGENQGQLAATLARRIEATGREPRLVFLRLPPTDNRDNDRITSRLQRAGIRFERFETDGGDYYLYDQIVALLGGPRARSFVETVLDTDLPRRVKV